MRDRKAMLTLNSLLLSLVAMCSFAVIVDRHTGHTVLLVPTEGGHHKCDVLCEAKWKQHLKLVQAKLAAEHKQPSAIPLIPLERVKAAVLSRRDLPRLVQMHKKPHVAIPQERNHALDVKVAKEVKFLSKPVHMHVERSVRHGFKVTGAAPTHTRPAAKDGRLAKSMQAHQTTDTSRITATTANPNSRLYSRKPIDKVKLAESILGLAVGDSAQQKTAHGVSTTKHPLIAGHGVMYMKWPKDNHFWQRLGYGHGQDNHVQWKAGRAFAKAEREKDETAARNNPALADHSLDYLHAPAGDGNPVQDELVKLGLVKKHSFDQMDRPVDHTLDYLHVPADVGDPAVNTVKSFSANALASRVRGHTLEDHALDYMRVGKDHRKIQMDAVKTVDSYEYMEQGEEQERQQREQQARRQEREREEHEHERV